MTTIAQEILKEVLTPLKDRATLVDDILASLDQPDEQIDRLWRTEIGDFPGQYIYLLS